VGTFAVQIAKALGAEVTAVCSTRNVDIARSLGAEHVIDYTQVVSHVRPSLSGLSPVRRLPSGTMAFRRNWDAPNRFPVDHEAPGGIA